MARAEIRASAHQIRPLHAGLAMGKADPLAGALGTATEEGTLPSLLELSSVQLVGRNPAAAFLAAARTSGEPLRQQRGGCAEDLWVAALGSGSTRADTGACVFIDFIDHRSTCHWTL